MFRRLTAVVVIWVSLLGMAFPAVACALTASQGDCCSAGAASSCAGGKHFAQSLDAMVASCCASGHAGSSDVAIDSGRAMHEAGQHPHSSPDPFAFATWPTSGSALASAHFIPAPVIESPRSGATLTYLRTARLRL